jgi:hypothetical protein
MKFRKLIPRRLGGEDEFDDNSWTVRQRFPWSLEDTLPSRVAGVSFSGERDGKHLFELAIVRPMDAAEVVVRLAPLADTCKFTVKSLATSPTQRPWTWPAGSTPSIPRILQLATSPTQRPWTSPGGSTPSVPRSLQREACAAAWIIAAVVGTAKEQRMTGCCNDFKDATKAAPSCLN